MSPSAPCSGSRRSRIGRLLEAGAPPALAALAGPVAGLALGVVTAVVVVFGRIPAIVATLGLLGVYRAGIFLALGGSWLSGLPAGLTNLLAARVFGMPVSVLVIALAYGAVFVAVRLTPFGAHLLAIGNSEARARLAGVGVRRVQVAAFVISGGLCGLAASFYVATYRNVEMTIGATLALEAVAAVVLGGTAVTGGRISLLGTAFGVVLLRLLQNGLLLVGVPSLWQPVVTGLLLLLVLGAEALSGRLPLERLRLVGARRGVRGQERDEAARLPDPGDSGPLWVVVVAGLAVLKPAALALSTVTAVLQFSTILALVALGQALVIVCGGAGIDLSVGGMVSLVGRSRHAAREGRAPGRAASGLCAWPSAWLLGLVNGFLVTRLRLLPLIATLGDLLRLFRGGGRADGRRGASRRSRLPAAVGARRRRRAAPPVPDARAAGVRRGRRCAPRDVLGALDLWHGLQRAFRAAGRHSGRPRAARGLWRERRARRLRRAGVASPGSAADGPISARTSN